MCVRACVYSWKLGFLRRNSFVCSTLSPVPGPTPPQTRPALPLKVWARVPVSPSARRQRLARSSKLPVRSMLAGEPPNVRSTADDSCRRGSSSSAQGHARGQWWPPGERAQSWCAVRVRSLSSWEGSAATQEKGRLGSAGLHPS